MATPKITITAIACLLSGCASMSPQERAWQSLHAVDVLQTLNTSASNDPCWRESGIPTKYLIGEKPSPESVIAWGLAYSVIHFYADRWLERSNFSDRTKSVLRSISLVNEVVIVAGNHSEGARPWGDNARSCL